MPTRRAMFGMAGAAALAGRLDDAPAAVVPTAARADVIRRGRSIAAGPRHLVVIYAARREALVIDRRTRRRRRLALRGEPVEVAVRGTLAAITLARWDRPGIELHDLRTGHSRFHNLGPAPFAPAWVGDTLVVSTDEQQGTLRLFKGRTPERVLEAGRVPRGLAAHGRDAVWVALNAEDAIVLRELQRGRELRRIATGPQPDRIAMAPSGRRLLVAHRDGVDEISLPQGRRRTILRDRATAVAYTNAGRRVLALEDVVLVAGRRVDSVIAPRGLAVSGRRLFVVSAADGMVGRL